MKKIGEIGPTQTVEAFATRPRKGGLSRKRSPKKNPFAAIAQVGGTGKRVIVNAGQGVRKGGNPEI